MKILFVSSELAPFAKTGGLGDVSAALPRQLHKDGHDVRVFVPFYSRIDLKGRDFVVDFVRHVPVNIGPHSYSFSLFTSELPGSDLRVYFVHCPVLYERPGIYSSDVDEHLRFLVLIRAALESCQRMGWAPDIAHANDWQTALLPLTLRTAYGWDRLFAHTKTVLTIHNLQYQGMFPASTLVDTGLGDYASFFHQDQLRAGVINYLLHGILYADMVTTVSPTYAEEIQTEEFGAGLHPFLRARRGGLVGILNGIDDDEWNPATDPLIPHHYTRDDLAGKELNKQALLKALGLPYAPGVPVVGIVSRMASQKGFDLLFDVLPALLARRPLRLVVLGNGDPRLEGFFEQLQRAFRQRVCFYNGFNNKLAHLIEAGSDIFLMPSRYEPCGLNQMYSLRYGTIPVVRRTGGLADTVELYNPRTGEGNGFVFDHYTAQGVRWGLEQALDAYLDPEHLAKLRQNGMAADFSWRTQVHRYEEIYQQLTGAT